MESTVPAQKRPGISGGVTSPPAAKRPKVEDHPKCVKCGKDLCGRTVEAPGGMYHQACFGCHKCGVKLTRCLNVDNKPYCDSCGRNALTEQKRGNTPVSSPARPSTTQANKLSAAAAVVGAAASKSKWQQQREEKERQEKEAKEKYLAEKQEKDRLAAEKRKQEAKEREERGRMESHKREEERKERERVQRETKEKEEREKREAKVKQEQKERDERRERERIQLEEKRGKEKKEYEEREARVKLEKKEKEDRERKEREERMKKEAAERESAKEKAKLDSRDKVTAAADRAAQLERERQEAQRIDDERKAKSKAFSTPKTESVDSGQSEWMQKVNQMNKKRDEKRQPAINSGGNTVTTPKVVEKKKEEPEPEEDTVFEFAKPKSNVYVEDNAMKPSSSDGIDIEVTEIEIEMAQSDVMVFDFEERVSNLEGYLFQRMKKKKWVKRWCTVKDGRLASYAGKPVKERQADKRSLSRRMSEDVIIVPLDTVDTIRMASDHPCGFIINVSEKEAFQFRCNMEDDVGIWISGLYHHINSLLRDPLKREATETRQTPIVCILFFYL